MTTLKSFFRNEDGATAIEYGLIGSGIAVAVVIAVFSLGSELENTYGTLYDKITGKNETANASGGGTSTGAGGGGGKKGGRSWGRSHNKNWN